MIHYLRHTLKNFKSMKKKKKKLQQSTHLVIIFSVFCRLPLDSLFDEIIKFFFSAKENDRPFMDFFFFFSEM